MLASPGAVTPASLSATSCRTIGDRPVCKETGATLHFVDDRLDTLLAVQQAGGLDHWKLYLADWCVSEAPWAHPFVGFAE
jgi:hypothetical protein